MNCTVLTTARIWNWCQWEWTGCPTWQEYLAREDLSLRSMSSLSSSSPCICLSRYSPCLFVCLSHACHTHVTRLHMCLATFISVVVPWLSCAASRMKSCRHKQHPIHFARKKTWPVPYMCMYFVSGCILHVWGHMSALAAALFCVAGSWGYKVAVWRGVVSAQCGYRCF